MGARDVVKIFDTTLRDGEQSPGASMNIDEKVLVARQLEKLGVDVIEAGFAASSPGDFESVTQVCKAVRRPIVLSLARAQQGDIRKAVKAVEGARKPGLHTFIATSDIHMEHKLRMARNEVLDAVGAAVRYARKHLDYVEFSAEDASRSDPDFLVQVFGEAIKAGAKTCNVPDTTGYAIPSEFGELVRRLIDDVEGSDKVTWSAHCHNDLGLAVANSLSAVVNGVRQVECTVNGIGERAGNTSLEEVVMALKTRRSVFHLDTNVRTEQIYPTSRLLSQVTGIVVPLNKPIVGDNAFAHEAGIHQDGVLKHAGTYEIMTPESVGLARSTLVMGKHSGRHAFREKIRELGYHLGENALQDAFRRFKDLADKKKDIYDEDIVALIDDEGLRGSDRIRFVSLRVVCGSVGPQTAELELEVDGEIRRAESKGDGPVDAAFKAVGALFPHRARLKLYQVNAVTEGADAQAEVTVRLEEQGKTVNGRGADTDTLVASTRAYVNALNGLLVKRQKTAPAALSA